MSDLGEAREINKARRLLGANHIRGLGWVQSSWITCSPYRICTSRATCGAGLQKKLLWGQLCVFQNPFPQKTTPAYLDATVESVGGGRERWSCDSFKLCCPASQIWGGPVFLDDLFCTGQLDQPQFFLKAKFLAACNKLHPLKKDQRSASKIPSCSN